MEFASEPKIVTWKTKSTAVCPFTQQYCSFCCALASNIDKTYLDDKFVYVWNCSLGKETRTIYEIIED